MWGVSPSHPSLGGPLPERRPRPVRSIQAPEVLAVVGGGRGGGAGLPAGDRWDRTLSHPDASYPTGWMPGFVAAAVVVTSLATPGTRSWPPTRPRANWLVPGLGEAAVALLTRAHQQFGWPAKSSLTDSVAAGPDARIFEQKG